MKGRYVERRFGWDTHGLPIEYEIDKKLGLSGKDAVEKIGMEAYNAECRAIVMKFATEWRQTIERLGRWIDFDNDYKVSEPRSLRRWYCLLTAVMLDHGSFIHGVGLVGFLRIIQKGSCLQRLPCYALLNSS